MSHDKRFAVKTYLEAGDFLAFEELCAEEGISQSSDLRMYIKNRLRKRAMERAGIGIESACDSDERGAFAHA